MGFEPLIKTDGSWSLGRSGSSPLYINAPWQNNLSPAFTFTGSATLSDTVYFRLINTSVLTLNKMYLMRFVWNSSGAPWVLQSCFLYSCVIQNGTSNNNNTTPFLVHADNGASFTVNFRGGYGATAVPSGLEVLITGQPTRVGSWTLYCYDWGLL